jgi:hypothetical protein
LSEFLIEIFKNIEKLAGIIKKYIKPNIRDNNVKKEVCS